MGGLVKLELANTKVTSAGFAHLKGLTLLRELNVADTAVGDEGLTHLRGCKQLRRITAPFSKVTRAGANSLKKELPGVQILR
jgi:hypothetical protein